MIRGKSQKRERAGNETFHCNDGFHTTFRMVAWFKQKGVEYPLSSPIPSPRHGHVRFGNREKVSSLLKNDLREDEAPAEPKVTRDFQLTLGSAGASPTLFSTG